MFHMAIYTTPVYASFPPALQHTLWSTGIQYPGEKLHWKYGGEKDTLKNEMGQNSFPNVGKVLYVG